MIKLVFKFLSRVWVQPLERVNFRRTHRLACRNPKCCTICLPPNNIQMYPKKQTNKQSNTKQNTKPKNNNNNNKTSTISIVRKVANSGFLEASDLARARQANNAIPLKGVLHPDQFFDCLCIFLKSYNTLVTSKICFL